MKKEQIDVILVLDAPGNYAVPQYTEIKGKNVIAREVVDYDPEYNYRSEAAGLWLNEKNCDCFLFSNGEDE